MPRHAKRSAAMQDLGATINIERLNYGGDRTVVGPSAPRTCPGGRDDSARARRPTSFKVIGQQQRCSDSRLNVRVPAVGASRPSSRVFGIDQGGHEALHRDASRCAASTRWPVSGTWWRCPTTATAPASSSSWRGPREAPLPRWLARSSRKPTSARAAPTNPSGGSTRRGPKPSVMSRYRATSRVSCKRGQQLGRRAAASMASSISFDTGAAKSLNTE